jgi:hypothetical protein
LAAKSKNRKLIFQGGLMKRKFWLVSISSLVLVLGSRGFAATDSGTNRESTSSNSYKTYAADEMYLAFGGGIALSMNSPSFALVGGNGTIGYMLDKNLGIQVEVAILAYPTHDIDTNYFRFLPEVKLVADGPEIQPYGLVGLGLEDLELSFLVPPPSASYIYPDFVVGGGIQYNLGARLNLFAEAKYNLVFAAYGTSSDIALFGGIGFGL